MKDWLPLLFVTLVWFLFGFLVGFALNGGLKK